MTHTTPLYAPGTKVTPRRSGLQPGTHTVLGLIPPGLDYYCVDFEGQGTQQYSLRGFQQNYVPVAVLEPRPEFTSFGKVPRISSAMTITEKIDGTNAAVVVTEDGQVFAQSRKRFVVPGDDNYGFAAWVAEHEEDLRTLGKGTHFGEWWGQGIQRGYDLPEKRFSLFNTDRWSDEKGDRPACCHVVPVLYEGDFSTLSIGLQKALLRLTGSHAAPGFRYPEGVMIWHHRARVILKDPFDPTPKGQG